jgi:large subunit ribosomal protein L35
MPKLKSKGAVKKRFKVTKSGKVVGSRPARGHMHATKNGKQARTLREPLVFEGTWARLLRKMIKG